MVISVIEPLGINERKTDRTTTPKNVGNAEYTFCWASHSISTNVKPISGYIIVLMNRIVRQSNTETEDVTFKILFQRKCQTFSSFVRLTSSNRSNSSELMLPEMFCLTSLRSFLSFFLLSLSLSFFSRSRSPVPTPFLMKLNIVPAVYLPRVGCVRKARVDVGTPFDLDQNSCSGQPHIRHERVLSKHKKNKLSHLQVYISLVRRKYPCDRYCYVFEFCWFFSFVVVVLVDVVFIRITFHLALKTNKPNNEPISGGTT